MRRVQISVICTRFARYLYSRKQSWIITWNISLVTCIFSVYTLVFIAILYHAIETTVANTINVTHDGKVGCNTTSIQRFSCILIGCTFYGLISCVCPVTDHEFHHNIVKVAVDLRGDSRVVPQTTLTML